MMSIKPSNVPEFLRNSAFFENLGKYDDEEVSIPKDCCKLETSVTNAAELEKLLRTLRFWGVHHIPETVLRFIIVNSESVMEEKFMESFVRDLPEIAQLMDVLNHDRNRQICEAVEIGSVAIVSCLLELQYAAVFKLRRGDLDICRRAVDIAAGKGNLELLKILRSHNCSFFTETGTVAARAGHKACLEYIIQNNCPLSYCLINYAFASGNLECLQYVHGDLGCTWTTNVFHELKSSQLHERCDEQHFIQCLQYAHAQGCPADLLACFTCVRQNWPLLLQQLYEYGWPWDEQVVAAAIRYGHMDCLKYAIEHGCPLCEHPFCIAMFSGSVDTIEYLFDRGVPWPQRPLMHFSYNDQNTAERVSVCLRHAYKLGCPRDPQTCIFASMYGCLDILIDGIEHGCKMDKCCTEQAAANGHLDCLMYLHQHGCPWDQETILRAQIFQHSDCLQYAVEHGCPVVNIIEAESSL